MRSLAGRKFKSLFPLMLLTLLISGRAMAAPGPTLYTPVNGATDVSQPISFSWEFLSDADYYEIMIDDNPAFGSPDVYQQTGGPGINLSGLQNGAVYYWRARAWLNLSFPYSDEWTDWSTPSFFTTLCPPPSGPGISNPPNGSVGWEAPINFQWSAVSGAVDYNFQIDSDPAFSAPIVDVYTGLSNYYNYTGTLNPGETYYCRVRASNDCGWGGWGTVDGFTTLCTSAECGNVNGDGNVDILDVVHLINFLYKDGPAPCGE